MAATHSGIAISWNDQVVKKHHLFNGPRCFFHGFSNHIWRQTWKKIWRHWPRLGVRLPNPAERCWPNQEVPVDNQGGPVFRNSWNGTWNAKHKQLLVTWHFFSKMHSMHSMHSPIFVWPEWPEPTSQCEFTRAERPRPWIWRRSTGGGVAIGWLVMIPEIEWVKSSGSDVESDVVGSCRVHVVQNGHVLRSLKEQGGQLTLGSLRSLGSLGSCCSFVARGPVISSTLIRLSNWNYSLV